MWTLWLNSVHEFIPFQFFRMVSDPSFRAVSSLKCLRPPLVLRSRASISADKERPIDAAGCTDPFCGLDILRMRYTAGRRPSDDMAGNALSWLVSGQDDFAQKSLVEMRSAALPAPGSHAWLTYANWALAFDWLYEHPAFDEALKNRVAKQLLDGAIVMASTPDLKHPEQASYHNYTTRFLGLTAFSLCAVAKRRPHDASR